MKAAWRESESGRQVREYRIMASGRRQLEAEMAEHLRYGALKHRLALADVRQENGGIKIFSTHSPLGGTFRERHYRTSS